MRKLSRCLLPEDRIGFRACEVKTIPKGLLENTPMVDTIEMVCQSIDRRIITVITVSGHELRYRPDQCVRIVDDSELMPLCSFGVSQKIRGVSID